jgi:hypothetical protein
MLELCGHGRGLLLHGQALDLHGLLLQLERFVRHPLILISQFALSVSYLGKQLDGLWAIH